MKSAAIDFHGWRGIGPYRDLFLRGFVVGFVTVSTSDTEIRVRIRKYGELLERFADRGRK